MRRRLPPSARPILLLVPAAAALWACGGGTEDGARAQPDSVPAAVAAPADTAPPLAGPVTIRGRVVDAGTGDGIGGAVVIVLRPGITSREWQELRGADNADDGMQSAAITDPTGAYEIPGLQRGRSYTVMVTAAGHEPAIFEGGLEILPNDPPITAMRPVTLEPLGP